MHFAFRFDFKEGHSVVTLKFKENGKVLYSVHLVPVIKVKSWPDSLTKGWESRSTNSKWYIIYIICMLVVEEGLQFFSFVSIL